MVLSLPVQFTALLPESDFLEGWKTLPTIIKWKIVSLFQQKLFLEQKRTGKLEYAVRNNGLDCHVQFIASGLQVLVSRRDRKKSRILYSSRFMNFTRPQFINWRVLFYLGKQSEQRFGSNGNNALLTSQLVKCCRHIDIIQLLTGISDFHHSKTFEQSVLVLPWLYSVTERPRSPLYRYTELERQNSDNRESLCLICNSVY